jgi:hypothetical protein
MVWALRDKSLLAGIVLKQPLCAAVLCGSSLSYKAIIMQFQSVK